jgi:hypothetical protein
MFKQLTAFILLFALVLQTLNKAVIYIDYYANTAAYAKNCENKARPCMHCNGKCQMMKKMKQEEKKDNQDPERRGDQNEVLSSRSFFCSFTPLVISTKKTYFGFSDARLQAMARTHFHPPSA